MRYRYRLDRTVDISGALVFAFFGVNASKAGTYTEDQTSRKWRVFASINDGKRYIAGNPFAYVATDVGELGTAADPVGPDNASHLRAIIAEADVLVPCWGSRSKLPDLLRPELDALLALLLASGKPVKCFGRTASGDPRHPLMLSYKTPLVDWRAPT